MLNYIEPVFRPPSEANSLILQVTNGCSWNNCSFCDMYTEPQKKFKPKSLDDIEKDLQQVVNDGFQYRRIFLADGDAMSLSYRRLHGIMSLVNQYLPNVQRVSSYCLPSNLLNKMDTKLVTFKNMVMRVLHCEVSLSVVYS